MEAKARMLLSTGRDDVNAATRSGQVHGLRVSYEAVALVVKVL